MTALDDLPLVESFFGIDLKTGSMIIAAVGIIHPMAYGSSFFVPMSYLLVTIWILVALFFAASVVLFVGLTKDDALLCTIWVWYTVIFVVVMLMMMILLALVFTSRNQRNRVFVALLGMLWYILTIYFILVVNSYRKHLLEKQEFTRLPEFADIDMFHEGLDTADFNSTHSPKPRSMPYTTITVRSNNNIVTSILRAIG